MGWFSDYYDKLIQYADPVGADVVRSSNRVMTSGLNGMNNQAQRADGNVNPDAASGGNALAVHPNYAQGGTDPSAQLVRADLSGVNPNTTYSNGTATQGNALATPGISSTGAIGGSVYDKTPPAYTPLDVTSPANATLAAAIDPVITDWRTSQTPPVTDANDPRHADLWNTLAPHVNKWDQGATPRTAGYTGLNALAGTAPVDNQLAGATDQQSPWLNDHNNRASILNRYYGGNNYGMFQ
jgi:hypothetical protein